MSSELLISLHFSKVLFENSLSSVARAYDADIFGDNEFLQRAKCINFESLFFALDYDKSTFTSCDMFGEESILHVDEVVLDGSKIPTGEHLFRLGEWPVCLIVTDHAKQLMETEKLTGISFVPLEVTGI